MRASSPACLLAVVLLAACANAPPDECLCEGVVPGGRLDVACGETQCVDGTLYECTGPNTATPRGTCGVAGNPRPPDAPDVVIFAVSGHCSPTSCVAGYNPEYLVSERATHRPLTDLFAAQGISVQVGAYSDTFYNLADPATGEVVDYGFRQLLADLEAVRDDWIADFDNPTRVIVLAHSHGTVWAHTALLLLEWWGDPIPVDILIDLDGTSVGWEDDLVTGFVGDTWALVIRAYDAETGMVWPFDIANPGNGWTVPGVSGDQGTEDIVPDSVIANLEVFNDDFGPIDTLLRDGDPNHRRDGSQRDIFRVSSVQGHTDLTYPGTDAMNWVAESVRTLYGL